MSSGAVFSYGKIPIRRRGRRGGRRLAIKRTLSRVFSRDFSRSFQDVREARAIREVREAQAVRETQIEMNQEQAFAMFISIEVGGWNLEPASVQLVWQLNETCFKQDWVAFNNLKLQLSKREDAKPLFSYMTDVMKLMGYE